ncbi:MAG: shikimate kinase [Candidatus Gastranaerophilales bacterium]|nr:shikimate kinase [Candidatus Gastranaerophilales bacterium]
MSKNIVLIGLMGSGKTTVGKLLAQKLDKKFIDTDEWIENEEKISINEIFSRFGESCFRNLETDILKKICLSGNQIISTGGGIVEKPQNIDILKKKGIVFYLYAPVEELYQRIKNEKNRPLLNNDAPKWALENLLKKREKFYELCDIKIDTTDKNVDQITSEIIEKFENYD